MLGWFLDRKDPKTELEGLDRAQKILDERYQRHQVPEEVYRRQREKYEKKLGKKKYDI